MNKQYTNTVHMGTQMAGLCRSGFPGQLVGFRLLQDDNLEYNLMIGMHDGRGESGMIAAVVIDAW